MRAWGEAQIQEQSKEACSACVCVCYAHSSPERDMFLGSARPVLQATDNGQWAMRADARRRRPMGDALWATRCGWAKTRCSGRKRGAAAAQLHMRLRARRRVQLCVWGSCSRITCNPGVDTLQTSKPSKPPKKAPHRNDLCVALRGSRRETAQSSNSPITPFPHTHAHKHRQIRASW